VGTALNCDAATAYPIERTPTPGCENPGAFAVVKWRETGVVVLLTKTKQSHGDVRGVAYARARRRR
jgi:hypothetical protein